MFSVVGNAKEIDWYAPSGEKIHSSGQDLSVSRTDEATAVLTIYHANIDSAGIYKCVAKNGDKEAQATVQVKIFRKSYLFYNMSFSRDFAWAVASQYSYRIH